MKIGIDIGGTNIGAGLVDKDYNIIHKIEIPTEAHRGYKFIESKIIKLIEKLISKADSKGEKVDFIGIGIPGISDINGEIVISSHNLKWNNVNLGINLKKRFSIEVHIENDATLAGIAESTLGVSKGYKSSIFITIGTGIGGGIIIDNKIYTGSHGVGSEIGHMIIGENFYDCNCGNNGCLETFASSTAMEKYIVKKIEEGYKDTMVLDHVTSIEDIDARLIFQCAKAGDELSNKVVDRMIKYLTIGITNLINILDPEIIVLGGGVAKAGEFLLDKINALLPKYILFKEIKHGKIELSKLGNDAGIIGAAILEKYIV